jgi:hypothetical protein
MKKCIIFIVLIFIGVVISKAQNSFELLIQNEEDQIPKGLIEENNGNIICSIFDEPDAHLIKINIFGEIIGSLKIDSPVNGNCNISEFIKCDTDHFSAFGEFNTDTSFYLWYLKLDYNLTILKNILIPVPDKIMGNYTNCLINSKGNYIVSSSYGQLSYDRDIFIIEFDTNGVVLEEKYWGSGSSGIKLIFDIAEQTVNKYFFTGNSINLNDKSLCYIYEIDSNLTITNQQYINWDIGNLNEIEFIEDSIFILSGVKYFPEYEEDQLGLLKLDLNYNHIDSLNFGKWGNDTVDYPAFHNNLSYISKENIFYGGTSNLDLFNPFYTTMPSWFLLVKLSDTFEVQWQKYYGGDAAYNLLSILATQDGGCVMAGTRYDYQTQNQERDVYILKVNQEGIITWTYNFPETTRQAIVYPNPGRDEIWIKAIENNLRFDLFDINGNKILSQPIEKEDNINTSHLQKGVYTYRILNQKAETIETGKWIKD